MIHGVQNGEACRDVPAGGVDIKGNIFLRVFGSEEKELCHDEVRNIAVYRAAEKDNALFEEPRENIVGAFAHRSLFNNHWDEHLRFGGVHIR